jgi:hypothetical protein
MCLLVYKKYHKHINPINPINLINFINLFYDRGQSILLILKRN